MDNLILWPLVIGVAVCAVLVFGLMFKRQIPKPEKESAEPQSRQGGGGGGPSDPDR